MKQNKELSMEMILSQTEEIKSHDFSNEAK